MLFIFSASILVTKIIIKVTRLVIGMFFRKEICQVRFHRIKNSISIFRFGESCMHHLTINTASDSTIPLAFFKGYPTRIIIFFITKNDSIFTAYTPNSISIFIYNPIFQKKHRLIILLKFARLTTYIVRQYQHSCRSIYAPFPRSAHN